MRHPVPHIPSVGYLDFSGVRYVDRTTCFDHDWTVETISRFELLDFLEMNALSEIFISVFSNPKERHRTVQYMQLWASND
jgi:hypothetical protein